MAKSRLLVFFTSAILLSACGSSTASPATGEAGVENGVAAVVLLDADRSVSAGLYEEITQAPEGTQLSDIMSIRRASRRLPSAGAPGDVFFYELIFQSDVSTEDRLELERRVADLSLEPPLWLGPDDRWPYCSDQPCILVRDTGGFP